MNVTSPKINIAYRGYWEPNVKYSIGDYVYDLNRPGYLYVATTEGYSHSETKGKTDNYEPAWLLFNLVTDNTIQWTSVELTFEEVNTIPKWNANTYYNKGDMVVPSSGAVVITGSSTIYYGFVAKNIIYKPDFPIEFEEQVRDNDIIWETRLSISKLLPAARIQEPIYVELTEVMDYLQLHEEQYFDDVIHKYGNRDKVRFESVEQIVGEMGYTYIREALQLEEKELRAIVSYLQMIHAFKGHKGGLEIVFELLNIQYKIEEWWEIEPKGVPHTWNLYIDASNFFAADLTSRIIKFAREYVYPILDKFEITILLDDIKGVILSGGFIDKEYQIQTVNDRVYALTGGFIDKDYTFEIETEYPSIPVVGYSSSFIDKTYSFYTGAWAPYVECNLQGAGTTGGFIESTYSFTAVEEA